MSLPCVLLLDASLLVNGCRLEAPLQDISDVAGFDASLILVPRSGGVAEGEGPGLYAALGVHRASQ